ncbi:MAG: RagB/SusD family nutrient uptake outer membrane protein [Tannerellaceae bacterium]|nr:RagB/SusD family nutrient uptake outer membrane protein [Tannerellaceae bacterium]
MKKIIYLFLISLSLSSCLDLEPEMYDVINPGIFPKNQADAEALIASAAYSPFRSAEYQGIFSVATGVQIIGDMSTDIGVCKWVNDAWVPLTNHNWTPNDEYVTRAYGTYNNSISEMTLAFERIRDVEMSDDVKNRMFAELHLARGWMAYLLYDFYGPVPIATLEELDNPLAEQIIPRPTKEWMVEFIETELKEAIKYLPANYEPANSMYGRFTRGLAYTILMKLYMHEAEWAKAEAAGRELLKPEYKYQLVQSSYADIFTLENQKNNEIIFAYQAQRGVNLQLWHDHCLPGKYPVKNTSIQRWDGFKVPWDFYRTFDPQDGRLEVLVGEFEYIDDKGNIAIWNEESEVASSGKVYCGAVPVKYGEDPASTGDGSQIDYIIYRFADVLTLLSEAITRTSGVTQEAVDLLNQVRTRANLEGYTLSDIKNTEDMLDKILQERGFEFWWEGVRRSDLIRHGKFTQNAIDRGLGANTKPEYVLFPLPQSVINEGKGKIVQNPGY